MYLELRVIDHDMLGGQIQCRSTSFVEVVVEGRILAEAGTRASTYIYAGKRWSSVNLADALKDRSLGNFPKRCQNIIETLIFVLPFANCPTFKNLS
jgi:hypothetical protein